jgi:hypothetical protein
MKSSSAEYRVESAFGRSARKPEDLVEGDTNEYQEKHQMARP